MNFPHCKQVTELKNQYAHYFSTYKLIASHFRIRFLRSAKKAKEWNVKDKPENTVATREYTVAKKDRLLRCQKLWQKWSGWIGPLRTQMQILLCFGNFIYYLE